jgi:DNA-directed RNA polymerase specialized sigma24 family protein
MVIIHLTSALNSAGGEPSKNGSLPRSAGDEQSPPSEPIGGAELADALDQLDPIQASVIRYRHGLDAPALSASETAAKLGRTRRQVIYIERMALMRLRELLDQAA